MTRTRSWNSWKFQSTLLQEERPFLPDSRVLILSVFQSTLLQEERQQFIFFFICHHKFQSTLLQEERLFCYFIIIWWSKFQSTLLQEERHVERWTERKISYFNPRSYKRSDPTRTPHANPQIISIHAPTRGATVVKEVLTLSWKFQSTLLQEERLFNCFCSIFRHKISIHAPTRGATFLNTNKDSTLRDFNPRSYKRSDSYTQIILNRITEFQSTLLQEERQVLLMRMIISLTFQSTLLQEERRQKCTIILILICNNYCIVSIKSHQHYNNYFM